MRIPIRLSSSAPRHFAASVVLFAMLALPARAQVLSYLLPDVGAPGMSTYVEFVAPYDKTGNFGTDGFSLNNPGDAVRVECLNAPDTAKVSIGPLTVSWNGRLVSTHVFVHADVQPNSDSWQSLRPEFIVPLRVIVNGVPSNPDRFYLVRPQPALIGVGGGLLGGGALGRRSPHGAMIVDSVLLDGSVYGVSTADTDPITPGNQALLPFVLLSRGRVTGAPGATISVSAGGRNAGPGGGGGGGNFCDVTGTGSDGGAGYTGGGRGGRNGSSVPFSSDIFQNPGESSGGRVNNTGIAMNGLPGGTGPAYEAAGGGTGHPFGASGLGCNDGAGCNPPGGYGGGSGQQQTRGGGGGGYATPGQTVSAANGGNAHGNPQLVPLAGGSGGAGGNPQGLSVCSGEGGGGGGAIRVYARSVTGVAVNANGADGQARSNGPSGSGSGGGISVETHLAFQPGQVNARGGASSIVGGAGRIRIDGPRNTIVIDPPSASNFRGPSTDTSMYVPRSFVLTGSGSGDRIRLYLKSATTPWTQIGEISSYANNAWTFPVTLPGTDDVYYLAAAQEVLNPGAGAYTAEPSWVFSQAAANVLIFKAWPQIAGSRSLSFSTLLCEAETIDSVFVRNTGTAPLELSGASLVSGNPFTLLRPASFPAVVPPGGSLPVVLRYAPAASGIHLDTLLIANNDTSAANNPWRIALSGRKDSAGFAAVESAVSFRNLLLCEGPGIDTSFTVTNTGTVPLRIQLPIFSRPEFSLVSPPASAFPYLLDPTAKTLRIVVRYTPPLAGSSIGTTVTLQTDAASCSRSASIALLARADSAAVQAASAIGFPSLLCAGAFADTVWTLRNTGTVPVTFAAPSVSNPRFAVLAPAFPLTLLPGEKKDVTIRYYPADAGTHAAVLGTTAQPCALALTLNLSGRKDSAALSSADAAFGLLPPDSLPATRDLVVRNTGTLPLQVSAANFKTGTPFTVVSGVPATIPPGGSTILRVRFNDPGSDGTYSDSLLLNYAPGCVTVASQVTGSRGTAAVTLEIDTVRGAPGEVVDVPVYLRSSMNPKLYGASGIAVTLHARADLLFPQSLPFGTISSVDRSMPLTLPLLPDAKGVLATLRFRVMLGAAESTPLLLDSARGIGGTLAITTVPGVFLLTNVCREGGARLFDGSVKVSLAQNHPNPFNPSTDIEYTIIESGRTRLTVFDRLGRRIATLVDADQEAGSYRARFDAGSIAAGTYLYVLETGTTTRTRLMTVLK